MTSIEVYLNHVLYSVAKLELEVILMYLFRPICQLVLVNRSTYIPTDRGAK